MSFFKDLISQYKITKKDKKKKAKVVATIQQNQGTQRNNIGAASAAAVNKVGLPTNATGGQMIKGIDNKIVYSVGAFIVGIGLFMAVKK